MHKALAAIDAAKKRPKRKFRLYESEIEKQSGAEPSIEIEVSHVRIACMNGRHRAVVVSNAVADYLR
eukprot:5429542-Karenia_brevis.AAC.1